MRTQRGYKVWLCHAGQGFLFLQEKNPQNTKGDQSTPLWSHQQLHSSLQATQSRGSQQKIEGIAEIPGRKIEKIINSAFNFSPPISYKCDLI